MSASTVAAIGALIESHRQLLPLFDEHLRDNYGQTLPHLVLADVVRWMVEHRLSQPATVSGILAWLETEYLSGPADVRALITVSGVAMIPDPGQPGSELRELLGPALRNVDPWNSLG